MDWGGAVGLPPLFAETLLVSQMKAEFPAGAFANRAAAPAPNPSLPPKNIGSKWGKIQILLDNSLAYYNLEENSEKRKIRSL